VNGTLFFTTLDGGDGYQLWKSDGPPVAGAVFRAGCETFSGARPIFAPQTAQLSAPGALI